MTHGRETTAPQQPSPLQAAQGHRKRGHRGGNISNIAVGVQGRQKTAGGELRGSHRATRGQSPRAKKEISKTAGIRGSSSPVPLTPFPLQRATIPRCHTSAMSNSVSADASAAGALMVRGLTDPSLQRVCPQSSEGRGRPTGSTSRREDDASALAGGAPGAGSLGEATGHAERNRIVNSGGRRETRAKIEPCHKMKQSIVTT